MIHNKRRKFYGSVTVSERGQVVIPAKARKDFGIEAGEKLLVLGHLDRGLVFTKSNFILKMMESSMGAARKMESFLKGEAVPEDEGDEDDDLG